MSASLVTPRRASITTLALATAAVAACGSSGGGGGATSSTSAGPPSASTLAPIHGHYAPKIEASNFVRTVDNPYWPLKPGTGYHYRGLRQKTPQRDDEIVTHRTKRILGIDATVVKDTVSQGGRAVERTYDFYAQDKQGNVWYMGENSLERKHGRMARASDSWLAGVNGGKPGIIMPANPQPGDAYRQEYYPPGEALDEARVLRTDGSMQSPYGSFQGLLVTAERSPLEPQVEDKYYAHGVGEIAERVTSGHHEEFKLVNVTHS
jgi:hypothetical protein